MQQPPQDTQQHQQAQRVTDPAGHAGKTLGSGQRELQQPQQHGDRENQQHAGHAVQNRDHGIQRKPDSAQIEENGTNR